MPRTRRVAAPEGAAESAETSEVTAATPDTAAPDTETTAQETSTKKPSRRRASKKSATADVTEEPLTESPELVAPIIEPTDPAATDDTTPTPQRRRTSRRSKTAGVVTETSEVVEVPTVEAAAAPTPTRGRRRKTEPVTPDEASLFGIELPVESIATPEATPNAAVTEETSDPEASPEDRSRRRRPGGRRVRTATPLPIVSEDLPPAPPILEDVLNVETEAPVVEPGLPTPVRRGRSRRRKDTASPASDITPIDSEDVTPVEGEAVTAETTDDENSRRGRRSRRGGRRRRGGADDTVELTEPTPLLVDDISEKEIPEDEDDTLLLLTPITVPVYVAPPLVPSVQAPASNVAMRVEASLQAQEQGGLSQIVINGVPYPPYFFFVNSETAVNGDVVDSQIRMAGQAGIHLYSGVMYLPLKNVYGDRSFGAIDAFVQQVLAADPDAYILPRLQFVPTNYWARTHPDQLVTHADGSEGDVSIASSEFWADSVDALEALIAHFSDHNTPGGDRIIGFHLDRGEWFYDASAGYDLSQPNKAAFQDWLHVQYQQAYALRAAWYDGSITFETAEIPKWVAQNKTTKPGETPLYATARDRRWADYALYSSELVAQVITGLATAIKTLTDGKLLVGASYGYTLEFAARNDSGHLAMAQVLASPDIDILAGPNAYTGRGAGNSAAFGALIDSVRLHGKLWIVEDDTKTFLAETETDDVYNPKIVSGADTQAAHQRHFGAALAHQAGVTWMDLWGQGWLDNPEIWREIRGLSDIAAKWNHIVAESDQNKPVQLPDVAVIVDEASLAFLKNDAAGLGTHLIGKTRDLLFRTGASVGFYLQSDVTREDFPDAKLTLFLNAIRMTTAERQAIRERLQRPGKTLAWLYAPGVFDEQGLSPQEVNEVIGMTLRLQPWNARVGSQVTEVRHPITERLRNTKRIGQDEIVNPSYAVGDPQATVLAEYASNGAPSLAVREHASGWKSVFFGDPHLTVELLRGLFAYAGVPTYDTQDDIVYASGNGVLLVHAPYTGQRTLTLPRNATVYDALENKIVAVNTRSFRTFLRARTTRLFLWGSSEAILAATGLSLPTFTAPQDRSQTQENGGRASSDSDASTPDMEVGEVITENEPPAKIIHSDSGIEEARAFLAELSEGNELLVNADVDETAIETADEETPAPRSRWQRRRAAARARREEERKAQAAEGLAERGNAANPPLDIASLLPDLPPRRKAVEVVEITETIIEAENDEE